MMKAHRSGRVWLWAPAIVLLAMVGGHAAALTLAPPGNLIDMLTRSDAVFRGTVTAVTDGVDMRGLTYTEVTVKVSETLIGRVSGTYTFRQIGLMAPRLSADGSRMLLPAPEGIPRYAVGEDVLLFMNAPARITGLQSPYGLGAGKFVFGPGRVENGLNNTGLFRDVSLDATLMTTNVSRLVATDVGAVNPEDFMSLVRSAVHENWIGSCRMWTTSLGKRCHNGPVPPKTTAPVPQFGGAE